MTNIGDTIVLSDTISIDLRGLGGVVTYIYNVRGEIWVGVKLDGQSWTTQVKPDEIANANFGSVEDYPSPSWMV